MDAILKIYLPFYFIGFILLVFVFPSIRVYRQTGVNPFRFATGHNPTHDYVGNSMKVFILLLFVAIGIHSVSLTAYSYLGPFEYLEQVPLKWAGLTLGHISLTGIMIAQRQMKNSWRIGIDYENGTKLVTTGLFAISRNPIYLFLLLGLTGTFLILPNALTLAVLFAAYLVLHITMRMEEEFLSSRHGEQYTNYKRKVRRLI